MVLSSPAKYRRAHQQVSGAAHVKETISALPRHMWWSHLTTLDTPFAAQSNPKVHLAIDSCQRITSAFKIFSAASAPASSGYTPSPMLRLV